MQPSPLPRFDVLRALSVVVVLLCASGAVPPTLRSQQDTVFLVWAESPDGGSRVILNAFTRADAARHRPVGLLIERKPAEASDRLYSERGSNYATDASEGLFEILLPWRDSIASMAGTSATENRRPFLDYRQWDQLLGNLLVDTRTIPSGGKILAIRRAEIGSLNEASLEELFNQKDQPVLPHRPSVDATRQETVPEAPTIAVEESSRGLFATVARFFEAARLEGRDLLGLVIVALLVLVLVVRRWRRDGTDESRQVRGSRTSGRREPVSNHATSPSQAQFSLESVLGTVQQAQQQLDQSSDELRIAARAIDGVESLRRLAAELKLGSDPATDEVVVLLEAVRQRIADLQSTRDQDIAAKEQALGAKEREALELHESVASLKRDLASVQSNLDGAERERQEIVATLGLSPNATAEEFRHVLDERTGSFRPEMVVRFELMLTEIVELYECAAQSAQGRMKDVITAVLEGRSGERGLRGLRTQLAADKLPQLLNVSSAELYGLRPETFYERVVASEPFSALLRDIVRLGFYARVTEPEAVVESFRATGVDMKMLGRALEVVEKRLNADFDLRITPVRLFVDRFDTRRHDREHYSMLTTLLPAVEATRAKLDSDVIIDIGVVGLTGAGGIHVRPSVKSADNRR